MKRYPCGWLCVVSSVLSVLCCQSYIVPFWTAALGDSCLRFMVWVATSIISVISVPTMLDLTNGGHDQGRPRREGYHRSRRTRLTYRRYPRRKPTTWPDGLTDLLIDYSVDRLPSCRADDLQEVKIDWLSASCCYDCCCDCRFHSSLRCQTAWPNSWPADKLTVWLASWPNYPTDLAASRSNPLSLLAKLNLL